MACSFIERQICRKIQYFYRYTTDLWTLFLSQRAGAERQLTILNEAPFKKLPVLFALIDPDSSYPERTDGTNPTAEAILLSVLCNCNDNRCKIIEFCYSAKWNCDGDRTTYKRNSRELAAPEYLGVFLRKHLANGKLAFYFCDHCDQNLGSFTIRRCELCRVVLCEFLELSVRLQLTIE